MQIATTIKMELLCIFNVVRNVESSVVDILVRGNPDHVIKQRYGHKNAMKNK